MVGDGGGPLQDRVGSDHLARDQVLADAEVLKRALGLRAPELVGRHLDLAEAVGFRTNSCHVGSHLLFSHVEDVTRARPSCRLVLPIARAGFSPFGQVLVQFMIVWQR